MLLRTTRKKKMTKRQSNISRRNEGYAELSREVNVLVELDANFPMMSK